MMINIEMINSYNANAFHLISRLLEKIITENYRPTILKSYFIKKNCMNNKLVIQQPHFDALVFPEYLENKRSQI